MNERVHGAANFSDLHDAQGSSEESNGGLPNYVLAGIVFLVLACVILAIVAAVRGCFDTNAVATAKPVPDVDFAAVGRALKDHANPGGNQYHADAGGSQSPQTPTKDGDRTYSSLSPRSPMAQLAGLPGARSPMPEYTYVDQDDFEVLSSQVLSARSRTGNMYRAEEPKIKSLGSNTMLLAPPAEYQVVENTTKSHTGLASPAGTLFKQDTSGYLSPNTSVADSEYVQPWPGAPPLVLQIVCARAIASG